MAHVFLSYSRSDRDLARMLRGDLCAGGVDVWADRDLGLGGRWLTEISVAISNSRAVVLLATPAALASTWVMREIGAAQTLEIPVVPLLARGARYGDLPVNLAGINGVDLADGYAEAVGLVVTVLVDSAAESAECARAEVARATAEARRLLLLTADETLAAKVKTICRSVGLVVDRPGSVRDVHLTLLASAHIAVIDDHDRCGAFFVAGYVAGRGGWVIFLAGDRDGRAPAVPVVRFCTRGLVDLEREICAAAFLPLGPPG